MITPVLESFRIIICLILYGVFLLCSYETVKLITRSYKKGIIIAIDVIYTIFMLYLTYEFSYHLSDGYIPIYFLLFLFVGIFLYKTIMRKTYFLAITYFLILLAKLKKPFKKVLKFLFISAETIEIIKKSFRIIYGTIKRFVKALKKYSSKE